jgi:hypothetical protein
MGKKISIVTLPGYFNYGNRLQVYALERTLESLDFKVTTLKIKSKSSIKISKVEKIRKIKGKSIKKLFIIFFKKAVGILNRQNEEKRINEFKYFSMKYLNESSYIISSIDYPSTLPSDFDYFISGSDQVWNYNFVSHLFCYFLEFAPCEKRIAYAASFGLDTIPNNKIDEYRKGLEGFNKISVREKKGSEIIKNLIGRDVPVVLDPTFLLTKKQWLELAKDNTGLPETKYLLTYFLSPISKSNKKTLQMYAKKNNLKIINLANKKDKKTYIKGPCDFINYINNCSIFCTDSFHGTVFSILLEKPFIIYKRNTLNPMYSRIDTLLEMFDLKSRELKNINFNDDLFKIDYSKNNEILDYQRKFSMDYLKDALSIKDDN